MSSNEKTPEEKLRKLGKSLRAGWQKLHPVTNKELGQVREVVREQWEKRQENKTEEARKKEAQKSEAAEKERLEQKEESQRRKSKGHDHGQSH